MVPLVLEELDDGVFGKIQLSRKSVDGLLIWVQAHIVNEALEDPQGFQRDLGARPRLLAQLSSVGGGGGGASSLGGELSLAG